MGSVQTAESTNGVGRVAALAKSAIPSMRGFVRAKGIKTGRVTSSVTGSSSTAHGAIKGLGEQYAPLGYQLPWETLDYVELLSTYNPDYSQAVENIKMLANTGHTLMVDATSDLQRKKTKALLEEKARVIKPNSGGIDGIIDKLLDQAATYGACAGEWVLSDDLKDVVDFADINPKTIRFFWEEVEQRWAPYQRVKTEQAREAKKNGQVVRGGCVKLNEVTFIYHDFDAEPESPYGTPPFLAALQNIAIQRDIIFNMSQIVKKIGLLGMIDVAVERLTPMAGETDAAFETRMAEYLDGYIEVAEDMARDGGMVHFDDAKITTAQLGGNAAGATNIHKANEEMVFSGLKSMPSVQGRSFSTTETYAGVAYEIVIRNTRKYQMAVKRFIERGYWLIASLNGLNPDSIRLQFNDNKSLNRLQDANSEGKEISNGFQLWLLGIVDQMGLAQRLGYSSPKVPKTEPPVDLISILSSRGLDDSDKGDFEPTSKTNVKMEEDDGESEDIDA